MTIQIGDTHYQLIATPQGDTWTAYAVRTTNGDRHGIEVTAPTEEEATSRLTRWLEWQHEHTHALGSLQEAERVYHRAVAGAAFSSADAQLVETKASRVAVDTARNHLDDVRARRPNV